MTKTTMISMKSIRSLIGMVTSPHKKTEIGLFLRD